MSTKKVTSFLQLSDKVSKDVDEAVRHVLDDKLYDATHVPEWVDSITNSKRHWSELVLHTTCSCGSETYWSLRGF